MPGLIPSGPYMTCFLLFVLLPGALSTLGGSRPALQRLMLALTLGWPGLWIVWMPSEPVLCPRDSFASPWERWRFQAWLEAYLLWEEGCLWLGLLMACGFEVLACFCSQLPTCPLLLRMITPVWIPSLLGVLVLGRDLPWRRLAREVTLREDCESYRPSLEAWQRWLPVALTAGPALAILVLFGWTFHSLYTGLVGNLG